MTNTRKALEMAIEFMGTLTIDVGIKTWNEKHRKKAIQACKEALEQPSLTDEKGRPMTYWGGLEQPAQEPEYVYVNPVTKDMYYLTKAEAITHPAPSWQGLSDDEIIAISNTCDLNHVLGLIDFGRAIEQALKEKNHE